MDSAGEVNEQLKTLKVESIKPINVDTVHKICSGQVVLSLAVAVKELVENSLDAGATNIDVRFKNYGIDLIEVSDNGSGVTEDNFEALTLKHHTSKLSEYSDLLGVTSFGFRGEALSSLCALASLTVTTRHRDAEYATKIEYDHQGNITKKIPCSRQVGTTVSLSNLFHSLPVRHKEFHKNVKREFNRMTQLLYAYCLISLGVKITCSNTTTNSNSKTLVVATQGSNSYKDNIACVFGVKQLDSILKITPEYACNIKENIFKGLSQETQENDGESIDIADVDIDLSEDSNEAVNKDESITFYSQKSEKSQGHKNVVDPVEFTGFISTCAHGSGRSSTDRQFYYVNSRPCEPTKVIKLINDIYKQFNPNQYPFVFLNVNIDRNAVDVNVTPDKRKVFLTKEKIVLDVLKSSLLKLFESIPRTLKIENSQMNQNTTEDVIADLDQPRIHNSFLQRFKCKSSPAGELLADKRVTKSLELKRKSISMLDFISAKVKKINNDQIDTDRPYVSNSMENGYQDDLKVIGENKSESNTDSDIKSDEIEQIDVRTIKEEPKPNQEICYLEATDNLPTTQIRKLDEVILDKHTNICKPKISTPKANVSASSSKTKNSKILTDKEDLGKNHRKSVTLKTSLEHVKALAEIYNTNRNKSAPERIKFRTKINPVSNKKCEEELSREISKDSFKKMHVVGQFNLGFIITRLEDDLFIIDQHATDEIYNFETLQKNTELTSQKLVIPQKLELTGVNEQILMDNLETFKKNGFTFDIDPEALPTKRVKLLTIPMSKNWIFGKEDIEELLFMLRECPSEYCRPSRVRAMFASRACRKSVMIGTALSKADMKLLVDHMADIDKPWNCPHGRPTIRHLVNLAMVQTNDSD